MNLEIRYYCVFVFLPLVLGFVFYYFKAKPWIDSIRNTKSSGFFDAFFSNVLMLLTGLMLSFFSFGLAGNILFKVLTNLVVSDEQTVIKSFAITDFNKNDRGKGIRIFAHVYFEYPDNETESLDIRKSSVLYKELKVLNEDEIRNKILVLHTKKSFWGIDKIINYNIK
ncbi:MAG TPA: hypothetical protein VLB74_09290 [Flavobacterium sp.]|uniref:hypothetical protein n=1 Tax=Flavobacterium sp. TaxID=239 RepID=UPI002CD4A1D1|nr:hypothetical protein [Flavobacterium sp.]HSD14827.1 hypothetical protein [Flavobacterium sp.]